LTVLQDRAELIGNATETQKLGAAVYDQWARSRKKDGWTSVMEVYAKGLKAYPKDSLLTQNAVAACDKEGVPLMNAKMWEEAQTIFETGLKYLPGNSNLEIRLKACRKQLKK